MAGRGYNFFTAEFKVSWPDGPCTSIKNALKRPFVDPGYVGGDQFSGLYLRSLGQLARGSDPCVR